MAETEVHLLDMIDTVLLLRDHFAAEPNVYVGANLLLYYQEGDPRKHLAPDVFVSLDVPKLPPRDHYLVWKEGKAPDWVVEITSKSTRREDQKKKFEVYRSILRVFEYFLFDPRHEYLDPPLQGFRLVDQDYVAIQLIGGRLPSQVLGLHLEREGVNLRLVNPATGQRLLTPLEGRDAADRRAAEERHRAAEERHRAATAEAAHQRLAEENERLRRELEALRRG